MLDIEDERINHQSIQEVEARRDHVSRDRNMRTDHEELFVTKERSCSGIMMSKKYADDKQSCTSLPTHDRRQRNVQTTPACMRSVKLGQVMHRTWATSTISQCQSHARHN